MFHTKTIYDVRARAIYSFIWLTCTRKTSSIIFNLLIPQTKKNHFLIDSFKYKNICVSTRFYYHSNQNWIENCIEIAIYLHFSDTLLIFSDSDAPMKRECTIVDLVSVKCHIIYVPDHISLLSWNAKES